MSNPTRTLASTVLVFEALVVVFAALVAKDLSGLSQTQALLGGGVFAAALVVTTGLLRTGAGYVIGSLLQVALLATAVVVPAMAVVGVIFGGLWVAGLIIGRRVSSPPGTGRQDRYDPET